MQLRSHAVSGVKWIGINQGVRQLVQIGTLAILAILLTPDDFGLLTMALVVTGFIDLFKDLGTRVAIIQKKDASEVFISSVFWINVGIGIIASLLLFSLAPLIARFYHEPRLTVILQVMAIGFPISGPGISVKAHLERTMAFSLVGTIESISVILGAVVAIVMAYMQWGVWSLVAQSLTVVTANTILCWYFSRLRVSWCFNWSEVRDMLGYSLNYSAFTVTNYLARNVDYLLIGRYLGKESLGYYTLAYRIMVYPLQNISSVLNRVMFPVLSKVQDDNTRIAAGYLRVVEYTALISFPLMLGVVALADPLVHVVFGDKWLQVIPLLTILAPVGIVQTVVSTTGPVYLIKEKTKILLGWGIANGAVLIAGFSIGLQWGIEGVCWAYLIVSVGMFPVAMHIPLRFIDLTTGQLISVLWRPLAASLLMLVFLLAIGFVFPQGAAREMWIFILLIVLGAGVYGGTSILINKEQIKGIYQLLFKRNTANVDKSHS